MSKKQMINLIRAKDPFYLHAEPCLQQHSEEQLKKIINDIKTKAK